MPSVRSSESTKAYWAFAALGPFAIYGVVLALLGVPFIQKQQVYACWPWPERGCRPRTLALTPTQGLVRP